MNMKTVDTRLMKALAHPLRQRILMELVTRVASPSELAEEFSEPLGNVSYHVRMLVDLECIELVSTTPRRGALEHHYKATVPAMFDDDTWASLPVTTRRAVMSDVLKEIWQSVTDAGAGDSFEDAEVHVTRDPLTLDEQGQREVNELLADAQERAVAIAADSAKRLKKDGGEPIETWMSILHFRAGAEGAKPKPKRRKKAAAKR
jgi:DNA-binding transcriptional ArsR family regulator